MSGTPAIYQINYARCIFCGLCIEACPTRSLTMSNEYELARDNRQDLIFTKEQLLAPLLPGMEQPPHPMRLGDTEKDYYLGALTNPGTRRRGRRTDAYRARSAADRRRRTTLRRRRAARRACPPARPSTFWILGPARGASARSAWCSPATRCTRRCGWSLTMLCLGVFYVLQAGPFIGMVQIIVYTGAIMMLFLFVLMLVGRDASDSLIETLRGQRVAAILLGLGFAGLLGTGLYRGARADVDAVGLDRGQRRRQRAGHRRRCCSPSTSSPSR